jgi:hypothetical protein
MNDLSRRQALGSIASLVIGLISLRFWPGRSKKAASLAKTKQVRVHPPTKSVRRHG